MLARYEALLLTVPEITEDEAKSLESNLSRIMKDAKGSIVSFERWGKYKLAYPVRKKDYGTYFLVRFEATEKMAAVEEIKSLFAVRLHELVMRHMVTQLDPKLSLTYQKPPSLEDAPARGVNTFLKENKMEGLMSAAEPQGHAAHSESEEGSSFDEDEETK